MSLLRSKVDIIGSEGVNQVIWQSISSGNRYPAVISFTDVGSLCQKLFLVVRVKYSNNRLISPPKILVYASLDSSGAFRDDTVREFSLSYELDKEVQDNFDISDMAWYRYIGVQIENGEGANVEVYAGLVRVDDVNYSYHYGESTLSSSFDITASSDVYQDTGLSIALPEEGPYRIFGNIRTRLNFSSGTTLFICIKLYNSSDSTDIPYSTRFCNYTATSGKDSIVTTPLDHIVSVSSSKTVKLFARRNYDGTVVYSQVTSNTDGYTNLGYERLGKG